MSSAYLRLLRFLLAILIPAYASSSPAFLMMYSAYKLNKQGDNIQPWCTPFPIWNQSVVPCPLGKYLGVEVQGSNAKCMFNFVRYWQIILQSDCSVIASKSAKYEYSLLTFLSILDIASLFPFINSCAFDLNFSDGYWHRMSYTVFLGNWYTFFWGYLFEFCSFV